MYVLNVTDDYDNITFNNCTHDENNIDTNITTLFLTIPCGFSFLGLMSLVIYTLVKLLLTNK